MKDEDLDEMLRGIPAGACDSLPPVDDGVLLAYRAGKLSGAQAQAVEDRLAKDPEARALLEELSHAPAPAEVDAVLARLDPQSNVVPFPRWRPLVWGSVAAALAAGLVAAVATWPARAPGRYQLEVEGGESPTRGSTQPALRVVGAESRLTLRLRAEVATDAPHVLGVFLEGADGRLSRLSQGRITAAHGSFELQLEGSQWVGAAGTHRLWLHVAAGEEALAGLEGQMPSGGVGWWSVEVERRTE